MLQSPAFRARDIDYFNLNLNIPFIKVKENYNIYYNVYNFINRLRVKANIINYYILLRLTYVIIRTPLKNNIIL